MRTRLLLALAAALVACSDSTGTPPPPADITLTPVASGLNAPVFVTAPAGDARLFLVEQGGLVKVLENGTVLAKPYLDLTDSTQIDGERGLLSLAFHPNFAANGLFYVYYVHKGTGTIHIARFHAAPAADTAERASEHTILTIPHAQYANHNGGLLAFGPDGKLWLGTGDGGGSGDPLGNGQNSMTLLGKLLRIDVDAHDPYAIPADNPFAGSMSVANEIWALGLRNPWRWAFDAPTGRLYIADVGQDEWEEVDIAPGGDRGGENYGWNIMEGSHCFNPSSGCNMAGLTLPAFEYSHGANDANGCAIIGGYVYHGTRIPALAGQYFYSDLCKGFVRSFTYDGTTVGPPTEWATSVGDVVSFGQDAAGELYVVLGSGTIFRIDPP